MKLSIIFLALLAFVAVGAIHVQSLSHQNLALDEGSQIGINLISGNDNIECIEESTLLPSLLASGSGTSCSYFTSCNNPYGDCGGDIIGEYRHCYLVCANGYWIYCNGL